MDDVMPPSLVSGGGQGSAPVESGGARATARCDWLGTARFSDESGRLFRPFLGPGHRASLDEMAGWMREAGMYVRLDPAGNLIGRYEGALVDAPAVLIGSHIDSVRDAGRYDGPLGVMLGVEVVDALHRAGRVLPFAVEVIAFGDEEGSRFHTSMLCSRSVAGVLTPDMTKVADAQGITVEQAMAQFAPFEGTALSLETMAGARRDPAELVCFLEAHIEQGPVLEAAGEALGVVTAIAGQLRYQLTITGIAGHAGTNAMHLRKDALTGAAEAVLAVERVARSCDGKVVATVGRITAAPGAVNVVPGSVAFSLDVRSGEMGLRDAAALRIITEITAITQRRGLGFEHVLVQDLEATPCDPALVEQLGAAICEVGGEGMELVSGAGHDAMVMAGITPTVMLFLRCKGGVSHHPAESVTVPDVELALAAMIRLVDKLAS